MLRDSRVRAVVWVLIGVLIAAIVAFLVVAAALTAQIRKTQLEGTPIGQKLVTSSDRILDCTDPGAKGRPPGKCYARGQQQTASVVAELQRIVVLSAGCAVSVDASEPVSRRVADITACVTRGLEKP